MKLRQLIREMVESELDEMARISTNIKLGDPEKASAAKELYAGTWYGDMIDAVEKAGDVGIPQPELARILGKSGMQAINPKVRDFMDAGIFVKGDLSTPKQEKPQSTGVKGRPVSDKTKLALDINSKLEQNPDYEPSEEEISILGPEFIQKLKLRAKGLLKRGRKPGQSSLSGGVKSAMKNADIEMDDDEDISDVAETVVVNESFLRMQKRAGLITESDLKKKLITENENLSRWSREVDLMTNPKIQQAWVDFYKKKISSDELKEIIKLICVNFQDGFYDYVNDIDANANMVSPTSSGSSLSGFYDFDIQDSTGLNDEDFTPLYNKMESAYRNIIRQLN